MTSLVLLAIVAACASSGPHTFGQYGDTNPKVAATKGERLPQHLTVQLSKPANVAVFLVVPGRGSTLLFPADSTQNQYVEAGAHLVETSFARGALSDTTRLLRRPGEPAPVGGRSGGRMGGGRGNPRDTTLGFNQHGYLLVYASPEPMPYSALSTRVSGISIPIEDQDALNTVIKLIRETTRTTGRWSAYATDFP
jgi:hypothetical protein